MNEAPKTVRKLPHRQPVLDYSTHTYFDDADIDRQWGILTEAVRREILQHKTLGDALSVCTQLPVSERLPLEVFNILKSSGGIVGALCSRFSSQLARYLGLPAVPVERLEPAVTHARQRPMSRSAALLRERLGHRENIEYDAFLRITSEEADLVLRRCRFARDAKMLMLLSEVSQNKGAFAQTDGEVSLPSGIKVFLRSDDAVLRDLFLNSGACGKRTELKDRVHCIDIGGKKFIMKEKKTPFHRDTAVRKGVFYDGLSSREEFEVARLFNENGGVESSRDIRGTWERPIGFVEFPDGYQFTLFHFEEGLQNRIGLAELIAAIKARHEEFSLEFKKIAGDFRKFLPYVCCEELSGHEKLTIDDFAMAKAVRIAELAPHLMNMTIAKLGYANTDADGYGYRISASDGPLLEIIGFDMERFRQLKAGEQAIQQKALQRSLVHESSILPGLPGFCGKEGACVSAAYLALVAAEGRFDLEMAKLSGPALFGPMNIDAGEM